MNKKVADILKYLLFLGIGVFLVWWSLQQIPPDKWDEFKESLLDANFWLLVPVFFILSASHLLRSIRWKTLMHPMGYTPSLVNVFFAVMIGYLANLAVPRLGEVLKCTILSRYEKVPAEKLVGTIVVERAVDVVCLIIVFLLAFIVQYEIVGEYGKQVLSELFTDKSGAFSFSKILIVLAVIAVIIIGIKIWFKQFAHHKMVIGFKRILKGIGEGLASVKHLKHKSSFMLCTVGIWVLYAVGTWVGLYATKGTHMGFPVALSALAFASIGMIVTPGGIGAYAFFLAKVLEKNNVPFQLGFANGTLQWFAQFLLIVVVGFICLGLLPWYNKKIELNEKS